MAPAHVGLTVQQGRNILTFGHDEVPPPLNLRDGGTRGQSGVSG